MHFHSVKDQERNKTISINPYAEGNGIAREAIERKGENLGWKVGKSWWGQLLEKGLFSLKEMMETFRMFKNTLDRTL